MKSNRAIRGGRTWIKAKGPEQGIEVLELCGVQNRSSSAEGEHEAQGPVSAGLLCLRSLLEAQPRDEASGRAIERSPAVVLGNPASQQSFGGAEAVAEATLAFSRPQSLAYRYRGPGARRADTIAARTSSTL